ncbi:hypothetical protein [Pseudonocardia ammonioxydans]|uniref:mycothiol-dependent nitroreductase Rv2466c family protein n=1 Tax=Pseudonocardia ammonioxydans TaxID=260086 RepID=UPI000B81B50C
MPKSRVELFADPVCPFAWIAYRWLSMVEMHRDVELSLRIMSLAILNDGTRGYPPEEKRGLESAWRPVRVAAAVEEQRGPGGFRDFFEAFGQVFHVEGVRPRDAALREALRRIEAAQVLRSADVTDYDAVIRESHSRGVEPVGIPGGTPTIHIDGAAFFGPILSAVPAKKEALAMFDGTRLIASNPQFSELKRGRPEEIRVD